jgi:tetratricopeptide (TPR) repeat protein
MPVPEALARIEGVLARTGLGRAARWRALTGRARLVAMQGRLEEADADLAEAEALAGDAHFVVLATHRADVELATGEHAAAERRLRRVHDLLLDASDYGHLASSDYKLADAVLGLGKVDEALELTGRLAEMAVPEDVDAQSGWRRVHAKALARKGDLEEAVRLALKA